MSNDTSSAYKGLPRSAPLSVVIDQTNRLLTGRLNATLSVTLSTGTSTIITDSRLGPHSHISLSPKTASAMKAYTTGVFVNPQTVGTASLMHSAFSNTDQQFSALIIG